MGIFTELKRRNVFRVGVAYMVLAWVVIQVTDTVAPVLGLPEWTLALFTWVGIAGFPFALFFAWAFELTPEGIKREGEVDRTQSITGNTGRKLDLAVIALLAVAVAFLLGDKYILNDTAEASLAPTGTEEPSAETVDSERAEESYGSIGVLPFVNMSNDPDQEYFSDGVAEELLNALAKLEDLQVAARTSSFAFKGQNQDISEIGRKLNVDTVLEGSVRKAGTRLRITAQLIEVETGYHLWSEVYDRELTDVFAIQDELTRAIVTALKVHLAVDEETSATASIENWESYDAYLKGLHAIRQRTDESIAASLAYFQEATRLEPDFAPALARQAQALLLSLSYGKSITQEEAETRARKLIDRALVIDPDLAEALTARGYLLFGDDRCEQALENFNRAIAQNPSLVEALHWRGLCLKNLGRIEEGLDSANRAHQLDPAHAAAFSNLMDFQTSYGLPVNPNLDVVQKVYPARYFASKVNRLRAQGKLSDAIKLLQEYDQKSAGEQDDGIWVLFSNYIMGTGLKARERNIDLLAQAPNVEKDTRLNLTTWSHIIFQEYLEAEQLVLSRGDDRVLGDSSPQLALAVIDYLAGGEDKAREILLSQGIDTIPVSGSLSTGPWFLVSLWTTVSLADLLQRDGRDDAAEELLAKVRSKVELLKRNGARSGYQLAEARVSVLEGDHSAAILSLKEYSAQGGLKWYQLQEPVLQRLADKSEFVEIKRALDQEIDRQRGELGWAPAKF
ncbi:MAG: hypothetical protein ABJ013_07895 [Halioglobus sp.]